MWEMDYSGSYLLDLSQKLSVIAKINYFRGSELKISNKILLPNNLSIYLRQIFPIIKIFENSLGLQTLNVADLFRNIHPFKAMKYMRETLLIDHSICVIFGICVSTNHIMYRPSMQLICKWSTFPQFTLTFFLVLQKEDLVVAFYNPAF